MEVSSENHENVTNDLNNSNLKSNYKKKNKKRRFISNAKGFGKKGIYGRGTHIEEDQFTYFVNILSTMKNDSENDKVTMSDNVLEQTIDKEIHLSSNQVVSQVIESLIGFTKPKHLERFIEKFSTDLRPLCSNNYASHILQKLVEIAFLRAVTQEDQLLDNTNNYDEEKRPKSDLEPPPKKKLKPTNNKLTDKEYNLSTEFGKEHRDTCGQFVLKMGKFLLNNLEDFLWDPYANHIMRTTIISLAGIYNEKLSWKSTNCNDVNLNSKFIVPQEWHDVVKEFVNRLQLWPQFSELPYNELSSMLMGHLCVALKVIDKSDLKHFGKKILIESFLKFDDHDGKKIEIKDDVEDKNEKNNPILASVFRSTSATRLLETLLTVAGKKLFIQLYVTLFTGRLKVLSLEQTTNFAVQRLIENVKYKNDFETIFTEIINNIEEILRNGCTGVVYALSSGCLKFQTKQAAYITALQNALHVTSKDKINSFFMCVIDLKPYEYTIKSNDKSSQITTNLHGSLIIQNILNFNKPIQLVNCMLNISQQQLIEIFTSPNGSFIANAFFDSKYIGEKSREKLIRNLDGTYIDLATTKFGSRVLEKIFEISNDNQKMKIAKELSDKCNQLNSTLFGRILFNKLRLQTYRLSPTQWKASFDRANKVEKLFKNIIT